MRDIAEEIRDHVVAIARESETLVSERDIAEKFNISRSNSRKLLMNMEGEGLLKSIPQRGYQPIDYSHTSPATLFRVRAVIEAEAARTACVKAAREDILRLMLIMEEMEEALATRDIARLSKADLDFHYTLVAASKDNMLIRIFGFILIPRAHGIKWDSELCHDVTVADHRRILAAVKARKPVEAEKAVMAHIGANHREADADDSGK